MFEIELEPEVVTWLDALTFAQYQRVMRNVDDYLVERGDLLDGNHTRALRDGVRELRLYLADTTWRISYWLPTGRGRSIVLLTAFQKVRNDHSLVTSSVLSSRGRSANHHTWTRRDIPTRGTSDGGAHRLEASARAEDA